MEIGNIVKYWPDKGYGFLSRTGKKDLFFHKADLPARLDVKVGDELQFEEGTSQKGPRATNIQVVAAGVSAQVAPQATTAQNSTEIAVKWTFGAVEKVKKVLSLLVWITLTKGDKPEMGTEVTLRAQGTEVTTPFPSPSTDKDGDVYFRVPLEKDQTTCDFVATVGGKGYTKFWRMEQEVDEAINGKPTTAPAQTSSMPIHLDVQSAKGLEWMTFTVTTGAATKVLVRSQRGAILAVRETGSADWQMGEQLEFDSTGVLLLEVKLFQLPENRGGDFLIFRAGNTETQTNFQPNYISGAAYLELVS